MEIKPGKFVVLTYDLYAGAGEPEETLMMRATDEMPDQFVFGVDQNILPSMLKIGWLAFISSASAPFAKIKSS